ncbi:hypothetical protein [Bacillus kexueae]|uniref:hypothetical protein n=1 Tax=Aeribacillus kexueae TaxID=2078952 RepID=UPI001FAF48AD|nr:hypothetical protein [Bacillus kexueae]
MADTLIKLSSDYRRKNKAVNDKNTITDLYQFYIKKREQSLLIAAASAVAIHSILDNGALDYSAITPQMEEAFNLQFPNLQLQDLENMTLEQLEGILLGWKGKYFEVLVRDQLNDGLTVGDIQLDPGQTAVLSDSPTQAGWDLQIINEDGSISTEIQLKATESLSYIKSALEKYPEIDVLTTEEVFNQSNILSEQILNSGISENELEASLRGPMEELLSNEGSSSMDLILPGLPFMIIAIGEGRHVLMGKQTFEGFMNIFMEKATKSAVAMTAGWLSTFIIDFGLSSALVSMGTYLLLDRPKSMNKAFEGLQIRKKEVSELLECYDKPLLLGK